ncbi:ATP-binding protein [Falsirhodobacter xinxiangensis]|uniref:ATP-binding protein n=1 Tax=Falsirhodobacter xinxiangensis TaxID=2530049 RepID=UPI0010A9B345|nr:ATP-binding protein [Rhodobacter xinxiangensis]
MPRESFLQPVRLKLAQRAAYRCAFPGCDRLTIGPGEKADEVENTGKAAHIYAASEYGPRGQGTLTPDQLKAITNGIWMCGHHADLIDKNTGRRYPVAVLKSWKALHEYRTAYEHSGRATAFGFVRSMTLNATPLFAPTTIAFGKTTFLIGMNESGKTALLDWLSVLDSPRRLGRWMTPHRLHYTLLFDAPGEHKLEVETDNNVVQCDLDDRRVAFNHHRIAITVLAKRRDHQAKDDLANLMSLLHLDEISVRSLAAMIDSDTMYLRAARFEREADDDGEVREVLRCTLQSGAEMPFGILSGGEQGRVIMEFAIAHMASVASVAPALLIVERPNLGIDDAGFAVYLDYFSRGECRFQTIVTQFKITDDIKGLGWQVYQLTARTNTTSGIIEAVLPI